MSVLKCPCACHPCHPCAARSLPGFGSNAVDLADTGQNGGRSRSLPPHTRSQHNNSQVFGPFLILSSNVRSPFRSEAAGPHMSNFELGLGLSVKFQLCRVPVKKRRCLGPLLTPPDDESASDAHALLIRTTHYNGQRFVC